MKLTKLVSMLLLYSLALGGHAASYPEKPVRVILGFAPGGNVDIVNRIVAKAMGEELKQPFVVENRAGANGAIGAEFASRAAPDGYTLFVGVAETHALNPNLRKSLRYDPLKDFSSIGIVGAFPYALTVNAQLPVTDLKSFIAYAKQKPGALNFSSWGNGSLSQIGMEQLKQLTGVDMVHVPFKGAAPAMMALIAGEVQAFIAPLSLAVPHAAEGKIRIIAVTGSQRHDISPNVPTLREQGVPVEVAGWNILAAPAGTPSNVISTLNRALNTALSRADVREMLLKVGTQLTLSTSTETQAMVLSEYKRWGEVSRKAGIEPE